MSKEAFVLSWSITGSLLVLSFHQTSMTTEPSGIFLLGWFFSSFLAGVVTFCTIDYIIDIAGTPRPLDENYGYTIPKVTTRCGVLFYVLSIIIFPQGLVDAGEDRRHWPILYHYFISSGISALSATLISYRRPNRLAYMLGMPIGSVFSMHFTSQQLQRNEDAFGLTSALMCILGLLPGLAVFLFVVHRQKGRRQEPESLLHGAEAQSNDEEKVFIFDDEEVGVTNSDDATMTHYWIDNRHASK